MKRYPFKFLDAYDQNDTDIFFGRDEEIKTLYEMAFQNSILLVYGASGTGKTSLIKCGLAGKFKSYDWLPLTVRRGSNINDSLEKILVQEGGDAANTDDEAATPNEKVLTGLPKLIRNVYLNHFKPIYLIFDQFEELYILGDKTEQAKFIDSIKEILAGGQTVKLIFSIREEYLGFLYDFERAVPQLLRKKLRVEPMTIDKVTDVLTGINNNKNSNVHIKEDELQEITEGIFNRLKGKKFTHTIQLPYLQVFLDKLYLDITGDESRQADALITNETLKGIGDIGDVLRDFLESQVKSISEKKSSAGKIIPPDTIWKILSPFSTLEGTKQPILIKDLLEQLKGKENITDTLVKECITEEFAKRRILNSTDVTNQYELTHDSLAKTIAARRTDEEIALLEIRKLINNQVATNADARELFTEKQLNFIEPHLAKLNLNEVEKKLIRDSHRAVAKRKRRRIAVILLIFLGLLLALVYMADSKRRINDSFLAAKAAQIAADTSAARAKRAQTESDTSAALANRARVKADTNEAIANRAVNKAYISAAKEKKAKVAAKLSENKAIIALNETRIKNLRNAASEYSRLIHDGPSDENGNADKFYRRNYFLAYSYHFDRLDDSLKTKDPVFSKTTYRSLRTKLYYDNELYKRIYEDFVLINKSGDLDPVITEDKTIRLTRNDNNPAIIAHKALTRQDIVPNAVGYTTGLTFCATEDNFIYVYNGSERIDTISMGAKVTALDYNEKLKTVYFGTSNGYIGYVEYTGNRKKNQPVFENKLESEITAIQFFELRDNNPEGITNNFLLATAKTSNPRVYKLDGKSPKPDKHLIGNELPYKKEYGIIENAVFDAAKKHIILYTSPNGPYLWNPFTYDLMEKLKSEAKFHPNPKDINNLINQSDVKFY